MTRFFRTNSHPLLAVFFLMLFSIATGIAQPIEEEGEEFDDFNFDDIPVEDAEIDYIGFGGGYLGMVSLVNYDELNNVAAGFNIGTKFEGPMLLGGGGGFLGGIIIPNTRIGVYGVGGQKEVSDTIGGGGYKRTMRYSTGFVAAHLEYAFFLPGRGLVFFPGVMVGRSASEIELNQTKASGIPFEDIFDANGFQNPSAAADSLVRYAHITRNSLHVQPTLTLDYAVNSFLLARVGAGYGLNFGGTWTDPSGTEISNVPEITSDGLNIHFGVFVGLFQK